MRWWALLSLLLLVACNRNDLGKYSSLGGLRVLSLQADQPEVAPGATVVITPLVSDIDGAGRALTFSAEACADPGLELGAIASCADRPDRVVIADNQPVVGLAAPTFTGAVSTISLTVPPGILEAKSAVDRVNGVPYLVFYRVSAATGSQVTGFKRVFASDRAVKNRNPSLSALLSQGEPLAALPAGLVKLSARLGAGAKETFTDLFVDGSSVTREEDPLITWFVSDGELSDDRTAGEETTEWTPPASAPSGRSVVVVGVIRDRRGGEGALLVSF